MNTIPYWSEKRVLITGGAGYLAFSLLQLLKDQPVSIIRLGRPGSTFVPLQGIAEIQEVCADIRDPTIWEAIIKDVDVIFHLAAQTSVAIAEADPIEDLSINVLPMVSMLEACRRAQSVPNVILASTATVCGLTDSLPVDEHAVEQPLTMYDLHKWMAENYLMYFDHQCAVRGVALRLANVYGPGPPSSKADRGILNLMVRRALAGDELTVYGTGDYLRDYVFVDDVANAFIAAAENMEAASGGYYLIGSGKGHTVNGAIELVASRVASKGGIEAPVIHVDPPVKLTPIDTRNFVASTRSFQSQTGWQSQVCLTEGIDRTIDFYRNEMQ
jgi:UDP-glucose 4-epimerase